ncbi:hypothetical protein WICPIJ_008989 [Wickerhamomyces pijperi]|uniref:Uncharacterized protein n=1 Tax=Wickerhamomyces pijperi TaxID=599730 RepID=A0A9P8PTS8_WICPI|nr:hypothetical protein WICPIJ_008989 [Wickerhamomyces pijperi]
MLITTLENAMCGSDEWMLNGVADSFTPMLRYSGFNSTMSVTTTVLNVFFKCSGKKSSGNSDRTTKAMLYSVVR